MASQYDWVDGAESLDEYCPGGYHPVNIGDVFKKRYRIVDKLGYGGYSTVWLAHDADASQYVALKIGTSESDSVSQEIQTLQDLALPPSQSSHPGRSLIPPVLDTFQVEGPNGTHMCYTTEPARDNLRKAKENRVFPLPVARALAGGLAQAVSYLHSRGYVHGDLHLRNALVRLPPDVVRGLSVEQFYEKFEKPDTVAITRQGGEPLTEADTNVPASAVLSFREWAIKPKEYTLADARVVLSDYGEAFRVRDDGHARLGKDCHTPLPMRPLEARFAPNSPLSFSADIWTLAVALWDLVAMKGFVSSDFATEDEIVAQYIDVVGPLPAEWRESDGWREQQARFFDEQGQRHDPREAIWPSLDVAFDEGVQKYRRKGGVEVFEDDERAAFLDLLRRMVVYLPAERITIEGVLQSEWMQRWALPEFKKVGIEEVKAPN